MERALLKIYPIAQLPTSILGDSHMTLTRPGVLLVAMFATAILTVSSQSYAAASDGEEFKVLLKKNDCTKCHTEAKDKKGPSYKKIAAKYKGKEAEGEVKMYKNLTTGAKVKLDDGTEEEHKIIDAKDEKQFKAFIKWVLSL
jgi:cytochrome c